MNISTITPRILYEKMQQGGPVDLVDVRTHGEFAQVHAEGARHVPLDRVSVAAVQVERRGGADDPLYVICRSGGRSAEACRALTTAGMKNVVNVEGGTMAWQRAGLPVVRSTGGQWGGLRAVLWLIVLAGLVLAATVNPLFAVMAVGGWIGLIVSGGGCCPLAGCSVPRDKT